MVTIPLSLLYRILGWVFLVVGGIFFFFPQETIEFLNNLGSGLGLPPAPGETHKFWLSLGTAYMVLVTAISFTIARNPNRHRNLMLFLALGKGTSSLTCLSFYLTHKHYFVYLANFLADLSLMLFALWSYRITDPTRPPSPPRSLTPREREILERVAEAFLPPLGPFPISAQDLHLAEGVVRFMETAPGGIRRTFPYLLHFLDWNPLLFHGIPTRLSRLPLEERVRILEAMERSSLSLRRQPILLLKLLLNLHAYQDPRLHEAIGYSRDHLKDRLHKADLRRKRGEKGPFPSAEPYPPTLRSST
jgi:hypothetical protein